jgi:hypothetical protein
MKTPSKPASQPQHEADNSLDIKTLRRV